MHYYYSPLSFWFHIKFQFNSRSPSLSIRVFVASSIMRAVAVSAMEQELTELHDVVQSFFADVNGQMAGVLTALKALPSASARPPQ